MRAQWVAVASAAIAALALASCATTESSGRWVVVETGDTASRSAVQQADTICVGRLNALLISSPARYPATEAGLDYVYLGCMAELGLRWVA
ncbi:MAG: hypothetical protein AB7O56_11150 [Bauldia sp.]